MVIADSFSGVRYQDVGVLIAVLGAVFIFRAPDVYELKPLWRLDKHESPSQDDSILPLPLITDLDNDGINELIVATRHGTVKVMTFPTHDPTHSVLPHLHTKAESSIRDEKDSSDQRVVVAIATGCLQATTTSCYKSIAVVASDWSIYVYNHYLKLLWKTTVSEQAHKTLYFREIAALVIPHGEDGLVIVGGRVATNSHNKQTFSHNHHINNTIPKETVEELASRRIVQTRLNPNKVSSEEDHFSTYAFNGVKGSLVWSHKPGDFEANQTAREKLLSSYHFKLALQPNQHHMGEDHWSKYHKSLLQVLPHRWQHASDTTFTTSYFKRGSKELQSQGNSDMLNVFSSYTVDDKKSVDHNAIVNYNQHGIEVIQLDSGRPMCRYPVTKPGVTIGDVNSDDIIDHVTSQDTMSHGSSCTAVVLSEGHQVLFQGPICQTLSVFSGMFDTPDDADHGEEPLAVPPVVVQSPPHRSGIVRHLMGHNLQTDRVGLDSVFMVSTGKVTSFGPHGEFNWQIKVNGEWKHRMQSLVESKAKFLPSMKPVHMKTGQDQNALFITSWLHISLVALLDGSVLASHTLPCQPVSPVVQGDFTNDGLTDVVIPCSHSYLGFSLERRVGYTWTIIWLVSGLSVIVVALALMRCLEEVIM